MIVLISGAPGSGRTTLQKILFVKYGVPRIATTTTRHPRAGEVSGVSYNFVTDAEFDSLDFCDHIDYSGQRYGLPERDLLSVPPRKLSSVVLNSHGVFNVSNFCYEANLDFVAIHLRAPLGVLGERILSRDDAASSAQRLRELADEQSNLNALDFDSIYDSSRLDPFAIAEKVMKLTSTRLK